MIAIAPQAGPRDRRIAELEAESASYDDESMRSALRRKFDGQPDSATMHAWPPATSTRVARQAGCRTLSDPILDGKFVGTPLYGRRMGAGEA